MLLDITAPHFITLSSLPGRITLKYRCMLMRALKSARKYDHASHNTHLQLYSKQNMCINMVYVPHKSSSYSFLSLLSYHLHPLLLLRLHDLSHMIQKGENLHSADYFHLVTLTFLLSSLFGCSGFVHMALGDKVETL